MSAEALLGHATFALLILSVLMTKMLHLRIVGIAAGLAGILYSGAVGDYVIATWFAVFVAVNAAQIAFASWKNRGFSFSADDWMFRQHIAPKLDPQLTRRLLATGHWGTAEPGFVFTQRGQMVSHLYFIAEGEVRVTVEEVEVGLCYRGSLVGEISILSGTPATATAVALTPVRYLALERAKLRELIAKERDVEHAIDLSFRKEFHDKIASANEALVDAERRIAILSRKQRPSRSASAAAPE